MKIFSSELQHNYDTYTFGYTNYCLREKKDALYNIYEAGYLPYSGSPQTRDVFYMARSVRIPLTEWELSSENRRVAKKFDGRFKKDRIPFSQFKVTEEFINFCLEYFEVRHGNRTMPRERLLHILTHQFITTVVIYTDGEKIIAYVLEADDTRMAHYWFSFYDLSLAQQSLGLWLLLDCINDAKKRRLTYYYMGTVYGEKSLYKTNFKPLEWWDGSEWNKDVRTLKERSRTDAERIILLTDAWKKDRLLF